MAYIMYATKRGMIEELDTDTTQYHNFLYLISS